MQTGNVHGIMELQAVQRIQAERRQGRFQEAQAIHNGDILAALFCQRHDACYRRLADQRMTGNSVHHTLGPLAIDDDRLYQPFLPVYYLRKT